MLREGSKSSAAWLPPRDWRRIWSLIRRQWQQRPSRERRGKEEEEGWEGFRQRQTFKKKSNEKYCLLLPRPALIPSRSIATLYPDLPCLCFSLYVIMKCYFKKRVLFQSNHNPDLFIIICYYPTCYGQIAQQDFNVPAPFQL